METQEGLCIALITAILAICYFSPNYTDCFGNIDFTEFFGNSFEGPESTTGNGPKSSLNQRSLQAGFPFYNSKDLQESSKQGAISEKTITSGAAHSAIRNYDGSISNGYQPFIIRPNDYTGYKKTTFDGTACSWPCYAGSKHQNWCNESDAIDYFAMRPLVKPKTYNGWLTNLFNHIIVPGNTVSKILDSKLVPKMFCGNGQIDGQPQPFDEIDQKKMVMKWLMERIAQAVPKIPQMNKNSSWKTEQFHYTDDEMYAFSTDNNKGSVYKLIFNLYNPLRSTATLVEAVVVSPNDKGFVLVKMGFVNKGEWDTDNPNLQGAMKGYNLPRANGDLVMDINPGLPIETTQEWNYGNTLNVQRFNEFGFYDNNGKNVEIKGGVPQSLKAAIKQSGNQMLPDCGVTKFTGINSETDKVVRNNGIAKVVKNNPNLIYKRAMFSGPSPIYI
jgi:hypothetical protein